MRALVTSISIILKNRYLIGVWVWKELRGKYVGSAGGWLWAVLLPLAMMGTYFFVFSIFLRVRVPYAPGISGYFMYLMSALLPWTAIAETLGRSTNIFFEQAGLVQKVAFPLEVLPAYITVAALFQPLVGMTLFVGITAVIKGLNVACLALCPVVLVFQFIFTLGFAYILSALSVFLRDIAQGVPVFLQIWFFASPILYPESVAPDTLQWINKVNPLALLSDVYHGIFLRDEIMLVSLILFALWAVVIFSVGVLIFTHLKDSVSDLV